MSLLFMSRPTKKDIVRNGLVLWLEGRDFYNSPPTTSWIDKSGNDNNGTPSGFAYTASSGSDGSGGIKFDGVDDCFDIGNPTSLQITGELTLECIIKGSPQTNKNILAKYSSSTNNRGYALLSNDAGDTSLARFLYQRNKLSFNTSDVLVSTMSILDNTYHHIACVFKPSQYARIYIDGILNAQDTVDIQPSIANTSTSVKLFTYDATGNTNASMKLARIYNRALTEQEIMKNYKASK